MKIDFSCCCGQKYSVNEQLAGKKAKCKVCGQAMVIPDPEADPIEDIELEEFAETNDPSNEIGSTDFDAKNLGVDGFGEDSRGHSNQIKDYRLFKDLAEVAPNAKQTPVRVDRPLAKAEHKLARPNTANQTENTQNKADSFLSQFTGIQGVVVKTLAGAVLLPLFAAIFPFLGRRRRRTTDEQTVQWMMDNAVAIGIVTAIVGAGIGFVFGMFDFSEEGRGNRVTQILFRKTKLHKACWIVVIGIGVVIPFASGAFKFDSKKSNDRRISRNNHWGDEIGQNTASSAENGRRELYPDDEYEKKLAEYRLKKLRARGVVPRDNDQVTTPATNDDQIARPSHARNRNRPIRDRIRNRHPNLPITPSNNSDTESKQDTSSNSKDDDDPWYAYESRLARLQRANSSNEIRSNLKWFATVDTDVPRKLKREIALALRDQFENGRSFTSRDAIPALVHWAGKHSVPVLLKSLESERPQPNSSAIIEALGKLKDKRALMPLVKIVKKGRFLVREACEALVHFGLDAEQAIILEIVRPSFSAARDVVKLLGQVGSERSFPYFDELMQSNNSRFLQDDIDDARQKISARLRNN